MTSGNFAKIANVFRPGNVYLAAVRTVTLQSAHTMVHLSLQQAW